MTKSILSPFIGVLFTIVMSSCSDENKIMDEYQDLNSGIWSLNDTVEFQLNVEDTSKRYDLYMMLRNNSDYPYYNLYIESLITKGGKSLVASKQEKFLFDQTTGDPSGDGTFLMDKKMGDVFVHQFPLFQYAQFTEEGTYDIKLVQKMREPEELPGILSVGVKAYYSSGKL